MIKKATFVLYNTFDNNTLNVSDLLKEFAGHKQLSALTSILNEAHTHNIALQGLSGSAISMVIASLFTRRRQGYVCIANDAEEAGYLYHDLTQVTGSNDIYFFPSAYRRAIKYGHLDPANEILRTEVLSTLQNPDSPFLIVTCPDALAEKVIARDELKEKTLKISVAEKLDNMFVADVLDQYGFEQVDYVYEPGQYAVRGSIIDVFSFSHELPYRIDFFGNEVETIRTFDVESQLSQARLNFIYIVPEMNKSGRNSSSLFESLPDETTLLFMDMEWCKERIDSIYNDTPITGDEDSFKDVSHMRAKLITGTDFLRSSLNFRRIHYGTRVAGVPDTVLTFETTPQPTFHKNFNLVSDSFRRYLTNGYTLYILSDVEKQAARIKAIFEDRCEIIPFTSVNKTIHEGFADDILKICLFTDHQLFDRFHKFNLKSDKARSGKITLSLKELNQFTNGDYIVHIDHGVGQFGGLIRTDVNGKMQEAIKLIYQNNDIIFVSIHSLHKLSKYKGKESEAPRLNKLGTGAWEKMKEKTKKKVKDIARDLILLYSKRREEQGFSYSPDSFMQQELEASFIYEDTPDQMKATAEVKQDMESNLPMDRLVCGDVGFGKTEVAIRAAFKAVSDNKQVAILVPTTVLAFQHYQTFSERLKDFPCRIDYISRARSTAQVNQTLTDLKNGHVNILIGTHRIVSKDVKFNDLGLLIIDEEQKFGVSVKEKLKQLKVNVDTLTMTATPIPRTLQFSLMGARDLSSITTPPPNRYPVQTEVQRFNPDIIREAINFEMSRNGQVFFVNNRIENIYEIESLIRREVPDARIAVGHGQMEPEKLEKIIIDVVNYEYDVLIATTIIESGIDIPNANTIIINNAHQFGLSDLHQLRGRVGRGNRKAFCYLLSPPLSSLSQESRRRLQAIENFSDLGSGIHIAMQDLDIRGAGNMLGGEQSGFIADLGYETYQKILEEAVQELKTDEFATLYQNTAEGGVKNTGDQYIRETYIESDLELMFPPTYIPSDSERISLYRELDKMEEEQDILAFTERLKDRFGKVPQQGKELIRIVRLRRMAKKLGMEKVVLKSGRMSIFLVSNIDSPYYQSEAFDKLLAFVQKYPRECMLRETSGRRSISIKNVPTVETACCYMEEIQKL